MSAGNSPQGPRESAPLKRSLFNKPSWSKPQALTSGTDLFHRSNQTYVEHAAEAERQRKRKLARKEIEQLRRADVEVRAGKRQRVSANEDAGDGGSSSDESSHHSDNEIVDTKSTQKNSENDTRVMSPSKPKYSPKSLLKRYEAAVAASKSDLDPKLKAPLSNVIDLEDDEDLSEIPKRADLESTAAKPLEPPVEDDEPASDEEFPELARQAREKARRKHLEEDLASASTDFSSVSQDGYLHSSENTYQSTPPSAPPDPVLHILITSSIPNTEPLLVNRRLSQRLKDVRLAWAERQRFSPDYSGKVFLTWRGKRLFDVTSCRSLGITAGPNGRIMARGENVVDDEGRIHLEAMTTEILEAYKKAKRNNVPVGEGDLVQEDTMVEQKQETQIRIICKAKGFNDFKLIVKPVSPFVTA